MAAFDFPENPTNGDQETNPETGVVYQWISPPGKWVIAVLPDTNDQDYVNITGDTMTGPLKIENQQTPAHLQPHGLLLLDGRNGQSTSYLEILAGGSTYPLFNVTAFEAEFSTPRIIFNSRGNVTAAPGADGYGPNAFKVFGRQVGVRNNTSELFVQYRNYDADNNGVERADAFRYFGATLNDNDITNKLYVDTALNANSLIHGGTIAAGSEGSVSSTGNLSVQLSSTGTGGELYIRDAPNSDVIAFKQNGEIQIHGDQQITATGTNNNSVKLYAGSTNSAAFGSTFISLKHSVTANEGITVLKNGITVNDGTAKFADLIQSTAATVGKFSRTGNKYFDIQDTLLIYGLKSDGTRPSWEAIKIGIDPNNQSFSAMTIGKRMYWGGGYNYFLGSVRNYLDNQIWDFRTNDTDNYILTELNGADKTLDINSFTTINAPNQSNTPGLTLNQSGNYTTLWNATQAGHLKFLTTSASSGGTCAIHVAGDNSRPYMTFTLAAPGFSTDRVITYGLDSSGNKQIGVHPYVTTPGSTAYSNVKNLPDSTPATLGILRNAGLLGSATVSVVQDPDASTSDYTEYISTQTQVNIPAQLEFEGRTTVGRGFTLTGCTQDQPFNTSAVCLRLMHNITSAAQLEYLGSTTASNECVQTKASVPALIQPRNNTWTGTNTFKNTVNLGNNNAFIITESRGILRNGPSTASANTGLNNGAIVCIDSTGATTSALYENGLYTTKKLIFNGQSSTQDILLEGTTYRGLNIKHYTSNTATDVLVTFKHSGSTLNSPLSLTNYRITNLGTPSLASDAANKSYVDSQVSSVSTSGATQSVGTFTLTLDGTGTVPTTKQTISAHYRKIGHIVHIVAHATSLDLTGYAAGNIRLTGLPFQPDDDIPVQIGHIHAVNFMANNYHADDDQVAVVRYDSTYNSFISVFAGQVTNESVYIANQTGAQVTISATYIAES